MLNSYSPRQFGTILVITSTLYNSQISIRLIDLMKAFQTIYVRAILLCEIDIYSIHEENGIKFEYKDNKLTISHRETVCCIFETRAHFKKVIDSFSTVILHELLKKSFISIRPKRTVLEFYDKLVELFLKEKSTLPVFVKKVSDIFKKQAFPNSINQLEDSILSNLVYKFIRNTIDCSEFSLFYQLFVTKLIIYMNSCYNIEDIDVFLTAYKLN